MDKRVECLKLWKQKKSGEITSEEFYRKLKKLGLIEPQIPKKVQHIADTIGGQIEKSCPDEPF